MIYAPDPTFDARRRHEAGALEGAYVLARMVKRHANSTPTMRERAAELSEQIMDRAEQIGAELDFTELDERARVGLYGDGALTVPA